MSDPTSENSPAERSTFLQQALQPDSISDAWLFVPALLVGLGLTVYWASWAMGLLGGGAAYILLGFSYSILAPTFGWRRIRWFGFFTVLTFFLGW